MSLSLALGVDVAALISELSESFRGCTGILMFLLQKAPRSLSRSTVCLQDHRLDKLECHLIVTQTHGLCQGHAYKRVMVAMERGVVADNERCESN